MKRMLEGGQMSSYGEWQEKGVDFSQEKDGEKITSIK
jgi:hypothetical protein